MGEYMSDKAIERFTRIGCLSLVSAVLLFAGGIFTFCLWFGVMFTEATPVWKATVFGLSALQLLFSVVTLLGGVAFIGVAKDEKEGKENGN